MAFVFGCEKTFRELDVVRRPFGIHSEIRWESVRNPFGFRTGSVRNLFGFHTRSFRLRTGSVRNQFRSGSVWDPFGLRSGSVQAPFGVRSGFVWDPCGVHSGPLEICSGSEIRRSQKKTQPRQGGEEGTVAPPLPTSNKV